MSCLEIGLTVTAATPTVGSEDASGSGSLPRTWLLEHPTDISRAAASTVAVTR